jgi:hypothetical protein
MPKQLDLKDAAYASVVAKFEVAQEARVRRLDDNEFKYGITEAVVCSLFTGMPPDKRAEVFDDVKDGGVTMGPKGNFKSFHRRVQMEKATDKVSRVRRIAALCTHRPPLFPLSLLPSA